jgi:hypothetical protein
MKMYQMKMSVQPIFEMLHTEGMLLHTEGMFK